MKQKYTIEISSERMPVAVAARVGGVVTQCVRDAVSKAALFQAFSDAGLDPALADKLRIDIRAGERRSPKKARVQVFDAPAEHGG